MNPNPTRTPAAHALRIIVITAAVLLALWSLLKMAEEAEAATLDTETSEAVPRDLAAEWEIDKLRTEAAILGHRLERVAIEYEPIAATMRKRLHYIDADRRNVRPFLRKACRTVADASDFIQRALSNDSLANHLANDSRKEDPIVKLAVAARTADRAIATIHRTILSTPPVLIARACDP